MHELSRNQTLRDSVVTLRDAACHAVPCVVASTDNTLQTWVCRSCWPLEE